MGARSRPPCLTQRRHTPEREALLERKVPVQDSWAEPSRGVLAGATPPTDGHYPLGAARGQA